MAETCSEPRAIWRIAQRAAEHVFVTTCSFYLSLSVSLARSLARSVAPARVPGKLGDIVR